MTVPARVPFYATLLDSIFCACDVRALRRAHAVMLAAGVAHHDLLRTKLSACYAQCGCLREARHIFARANRRPAFLYNALIRAYADRGLYLPSVALYREMALEGKPPDPRALASALRSCAALASLRLGRLLHVAAVVEGLTSEAVVVNSLVAMYAKCGDIASARNLFDGMPQRTVVSWTAMIAGLGAHGRAEHALELFDEMLETGERPDAKAITAVLAACSHGGLVEAGERLFRGMEERFGVRPTVEHYTCMVDMLGRAGRVEDAEALVGEMEGAPDEALWGALLAACRAQGKLHAALRVAQQVYSGERDADKPCNNEGLVPLLLKQSMINKRGEGVDEKIKKLDTELARYKEQIKKTRPGPAQEAVKARAMRVLKQKRMLVTTLSSIHFCQYEGQRDMLFNQTFNLDQVAFAAEGLKDAQQTMSALKSANKELKGMMKTVKISDIDVHTHFSMQDDMMDLMDISTEIQESLGRSYNVPDDIDEEELLGELDALEADMENEADAVPSYLQPDKEPDVEAELNLPAAPSGHAAAQPVQAVDEMGLPAVPRASLRG
ncbi:hypothetical protein Taro_019763 [Colocasia esculenta]|uniref:Uncharacterized protein n=1 Tax=Colocasia esculenta TaxID=4460 RepID=A0A843V099_COLES|nr:hypothetical protein [Colocasia esculenta]